MNYFYCEFFDLLTGFFLSFRSISNFKFHVFVDRSIFAFHLAFNEDKKSISQICSVHKRHCFVECTQIFGDFLTTTNVLVFRFIPFLCEQTTILYRKIEIAFIICTLLLCVRMCRYFHCNLDSNKYHCILKYLVILYMYWYHLIASEMLERCTWIAFSLADVSMQNGIKKRSEKKRMEIENKENDITIIFRFLLGFVFLAFIIPFLLCIILNKYI